MTSLKVAPDNVDDYGFYFVGIDWITGQEVFAQWVGNGSMFDAALMLGAFNSDGGYIAPTRNGFLHDFRSVTGLSFRREDAA